MLVGGHQRGTWEAGDQPALFARDREGAQDMGLSVKGLGRP